MLFGAAEEIAPPCVDSHGLKTLPMRLGFDRFGDHLHVETMGDIRNRFDEKPAVLLLVEMANITAVDLQVMRLDRAQIGEGENPLPK